MQQYQQEAERYQNNDRDTFEEFKKDFENTITNLTDCIVKVVSKNSSGEYANRTDIKNGRFIGESNMHQKPSNSKKRLNFSEIVFNQLCLAMKYLNKEISEFNLKCWYGFSVIDQETKKTAELFFPQGEDGLVKEGERKFLAGTDAFIALAGTPTAQSKFYLLAQHSKAFKDKKVTSITVIRRSYSIIDINYEFGS